MKNIRSFCISSVLALVPPILIFLFYFRVLGGGFNLEDTMFLGDAAKVLTAGNFKYLFVPWLSNYVRLFRQPIFVVIYKFFGYNPAPYFFVGLFFHTLNSLLVFLLAKKLTGSKIISFFSSMFYGFFQVNFEGIFWISAGTKDVPMTTFFLLCLIAFIFFLESEKIRYLYSSCFFFFIALNCEFKAFLTPLVLMAYELLLAKRKAKPSLFTTFKKYWLFLFVILISFLAIYSKTIMLFAGSRNRAYWLTFPASLPFYFLPIYRIFWVKVFTNAWGLTLGHSDEVFLEEMGLVILATIIILVIFFWLRRKKEKSRKILFLLSAVFINYFPVVLMVLSGYHSVWETVTTHWRYATLSSSLAAIMVVAICFWLNEEIFSGWFTPLVKFPILVVVFLGTLLGFHIQTDEFMLRNFLNWSIPAKNNFLKMKTEYPVFPKEAVLAIEGAEDEEKYLYYQNRYLFENIFALYAQPNNPNYLAEQRNLVFEPDEGPFRSLPRLLYYTNLKDFLIGSHGHIFQSGEEINWITLNLPWSLSAYDRLFIGSIYGFYEQGRAFIYKFDEKGIITDVTQERRKQILAFLKYFCFENGTKGCNSERLEAVSNIGIKDSLNLFSEKGRKIVEILINQQKGALPPLEKIEI